MDEHDLEQRLRDTGAAVRGTAPDRHEVADALAAVSARRPGRQWIAPAALVGVAAGVVGLLVWLAGPGDSAEPPAPADSVHVSPKPVETTPTSVLLDADWRIDKENWDGRGGRCVTVEADGGQATGCIEGNRLGVELWAAIGPQPMVLFPHADADGYSVGRSTFSGDVLCDPGLLPRGRLHEFRCASGVQQMRTLPERPVHEFTPVVARGLPYEFEPIRVDGVRGATAYLSRPIAGVGDRCLVLLVDDRPGWFEACDEFIAGSSLAIAVSDALWIVDVAHVDAGRVSIAGAATSASIHGCAETMPTILRRLDLASMANGLVCSSKTGVVTASRHRVTTWVAPGLRARRICFGTADCGERGIPPRPLPIAPGSAYRPATDDIIGVDDLTSEAGDVDLPAHPGAVGIGQLVGRHFQDRSEPPGTLVRSVDAIEESPLVLVEVAVLDDAAGDETYAVWLDGGDDGLGIERLYRIRTCARGIDTASGRCV